MYSVIIKNGRVIDGLGKNDEVLDVALEGDQIVAIDRDIPVKGATVIDASGKIVTPGFVDIQNHSDSYWTIFDNPSLDSLITQGFTSILIGQCGASLAPLLSKDSLLSIRKWHDLSGANINWTTFSEYIEELSRSRFGCNIAPLVGYSTLRRGLVGDQTRSLDPSEIKSLKAQLANSIEAGAFGLSSGLSYSHEIIISELELFELVSLIAEYDRLFSMHLRNESAEILESLEEALDIARHTNVNLKISHLKIRGKQNAHLVSDLVERLENGFHKGLRVHYDSYPYDSIWQVVYSYLPKWSVLGGRGATISHIENANDKKKLLAELSELGARLQEMVVASTGNQLGMVGKRIADISKNTGLSAEEVFVELIKNGGSESLVFDSCVDESVVNELLLHPQGFVATDGAGFADRSKFSKIQDRLVHPRCFGTAPKFLRMVIDNKKLSLPEAIRKLSYGPAEKIGLSRRGALLVGNFADVVVMDPLKLRDNATLMNPYQYSSGIDYVFVNGRMVLDQGVTNGVLSGYVLRKT